MVEETNGPKKRSQSCAKRRRVVSHEKKILWAEINP